MLRLRHSPVAPAPDRHLSTDPGRLETPLLDYRFAAEDLNGTDTKMSRATPLLSLVLLVSAVPLAAESATVLHLDRSVEIERTLPDPTDLWVPPSDLERVSGFVLKPEGACLDDLCVPVRQDGDSDIFVRRSGEGWLNVTELADRLEQKYAFDSEHRVWSFGEVPATRAAFHDRAIAPDFSLPDREGNLVRLSDFRGKKVMLLSWASW